MNVDTISVGAFEANCFIVWGPTNQALIIDPGADAQEICEHIEQNHLTVAAYLLTHGHPDHISAVSKMYATSAAPILIHADDQEWAFSPNNQMLPYYPAPDLPSLDMVQSIEDGQERTDAGLAYKVIGTPGHTPGGVCFYFERENLLVVGDTLFAGSVGRTDFPGGDSRLLAASLDKLARLPDNTTVYTGHGHETTIGREKTTNYFMRRP